MKSKPKPTSSRRVWTKLKSGLFGWKYSKTVSVPSKPSHGKLSNISKISTQTRIKNFETNSVTETHQVLPPKTFFFGGGSSAGARTLFGNNSNIGGLNLAAGNSSSERTAGGQIVDYVETKKTGGELLSYKQQKTNS